MEPIEVKLKSIQYSLSRLKRKFESVAFEFDVFQEHFNDLLILSQPQQNHEGGRSLPTPGDGNGDAKEACCLCGKTECSCDSKICTHKKQVRHSSNNGDNWCLDCGSLITPEGKGNTPNTDCEHPYYGVDRHGVCSLCKTQL